MTPKGSADTLMLFQGEIRKGDKIEILVSNAFVVCWPAKGWRSWPKAAAQAGPKSMPELVGLAWGSLKRKIRIKVKVAGGECQWPNLNIVNELRFDGGEVEKSKP